MLRSAALFIYLLFIYLFINFIKKKKKKWGPALSEVGLVALWGPWGRGFWPLLVRGFIGGGSGRGQGQWGAVDAPCWGMGEGNPLGAQTCPGYRSPW